MIEVIGQHNTAICYTGELETAAAEQIKAVCDQPAFADCKIRIMPDVHAGMGCTIGTTMTITDKIVLSSLQIVQDQTPNTLLFGYPLLYPFRKEYNRA